MENVNVEIVKKYYDKLCVICDQLDENNLWDRPDADAFRLRNIFRHDVGEYMMFLSSSDSAITFEEADLYGIVTGYDNDRDKMNEYIKNHALYSCRFKTEVPLSICLIDECEDRAVENGIHIDLKVNKSFTELFVDFFALLSKVLSGVDGEVAMPEKKDSAGYIAMLREYVANNNNPIEYYYKLVENL